jgi:hypothetical protein
MNVNQVAFFTSAVLTTATIGSVIAAATAATTVATVAYSILGIGCGAGSLASISAWASTEDKDNKNIPQYFETVKEHTAYAFTGITQVFSQAAIQAIIRGVCDGIATVISNKITGKS